MDPITTAIIAAASGGLAQPLVNDLYASLMQYVRSKYGKSNLPATLDMLENSPESAALPDLLCEEVKRTGADKDAELTRLAEEILDSLQSSREGQRIIEIVKSKVGVICGDNATFKGDINL